MNRLVKNKKGIINLFILIGIVPLVIMLLAIFFMFYQVNILSHSIKRDITYIANNALIFFDKEELAYSNYEMNISEVKKTFQKLIQANYINAKSCIEEINILEFEFYPQKGSHCLPNKINVIHLVILVKFKPVIKIPLARETNFTVHDDVSISLLDYEGVI